jgi:hypothetical protein
MKNIHLLPTDKARLYIHQGKLYDNKKTMHIPDGKQIPHQIYITNDEKPKSEDWHLNIVTNKISKYNIGLLNPNRSNYKKIILTTDKDLIKDNVQAIDDTFLEWFVQNPSCEKVEVEEVKCTGQCWKFIESDYEETCLSGCEKLEYKIFIPQEEPKKETLEEAAEQYSRNGCWEGVRKQGFIAGAKWQAERMYSEEEVKELCKKSRDEGYDENTLEGIGANEKIVPFGEWFEQVKKK